MLQYYEIIWEATRSEEHFKNLVEYVSSSGVGKDEVLSLTGQWSSFKEKPVYLRFSILVKLICMVIERNTNIIVELKIIDAALKLLEKLREDLIMEINEYKVDNLPLNEALNSIEDIVNRLKPLKDAQPT